MLLPPETYFVGHFIAPQPTPLPETQFELSRPRIPEVWGRRKGGSVCLTRDMHPTTENMRRCRLHVCLEHQKNIFNITEIFSRKHIRTCDNPPVNHQLCLHGQPKLKVPNYFKKKETRHKQDVTAVAVLCLFLKLCFVLLCDYFLCLLFLGSSKSKIV